MSGKCLFLCMIRLGIRAYDGYKTDRHKTSGACRKNEDYGVWHLIVYSV